MRSHIVRLALVVASIAAVSSAQTLAVAQPLAFTRAATTRAPAYRATVTPLPAAIRKLMKGSSWHSGCPVALDDLRLIRLTYWGFDKAAHRGKLVVNKRWAAKVAVVFGKIYDARFPIRKMHLVDRYGADDMRSMKADNTSAFNCRYRNNVCCVWSQHAYGRAIDINPVENPYVGPWGVSPPNGAEYVKRKPLRKGMLSFHDRVWWAFHRIGWEWGGSWSWPIDYQHYSSNNR
jgi:D-alanyl-D-alanine carboxypeptidase-like protein